MPNPQKHDIEQGITLFSWTWDNKFPKEIGQYYITAVKGSQPIGTTKVAFSLLTSQSPCITLDDGNGNKTNCDQASQIPSIQTLSTTKLIIYIHGSNWIVGHNSVNSSANPITETVEVSATCANSQHCTPDSLFDTQIISNTTEQFTKDISLPQSTHGTYLVKAISHVKQIGTPSASSNSALNFEPESSITVNIDVHPPSTALPISTPLSNSTPLANPTIYPNISVVNKLSIISALPAIFGIILFLIAMIQERLNEHKHKQNIGVQSTRPGHNRQGPGFPQVTNTNLSQPSPSLTSPTLTSPSIGQHPLLHHDYPLAPFPPRLVAAQQHSKFNLTLPWPSINRKIQKAVKRWHHENNLDDAIYLASQLLRTNLTRWDTLTHALKKEHEQCTKNPTPNLQQVGIKAVHAMQNYGYDREFLMNCSTALLCYTVLLKQTPTNSLQSADILYKMGFAYINLATMAPQTTSNLLIEATKCYNSALNIYQTLSVNLAEVALPRAKTFMSIGDVYFAKGNLLEHGQHNFVKALEYYLQSHYFNFTDNEIRTRIEITRQNLTIGRE